jgi:Fe-S-cluster containining protein
VDTQLALIEDPVNYDCVFLKDKRCSVYEARPVQCRTFPWWIQHLREPTDWQAAKERCEGIDHPDAPVVASDTIAEQCLIYLDNLVAQHFIYEQ